ncbi:MAG: cobalamin B12-binding domain-containing protein [Spirochaetes bacterium]|nr:cobalamin B12-binding domain-containing protein [Spirochaetota bacterium]
MDETSTIGQNRKVVIEAILEGEKEKADALLDAYAAEHGYRDTMTAILEPVLEEIGTRWAAESISLAQGYIAGKVAEALLLKISREEAASDAEPAKKRPVVLGNIEDDYHSLGRKLVAIFLQSAGWDVIDLGGDVSAADFVDKAVASAARVIGVSAMMYTTAENIKKVRAELDRRNLSGKIMLAVGGAVFRLRPELCSEVGGDGTAANGFQTPELFAELWERALAGGPL